MHYIYLYCISTTCNQRLEQKRGSKPFLLPFLFKIFALAHQDVSNYLESVTEKQNVPSTLLFIKQTLTNEFQWANGTKPISLVLISFIQSLNSFFSYSSLINVIFSIVAQYLYYKYVILEQLLLGLKYSSA